MGSKEAVIAKLYQKLEDEPDMDEAEYRRILSRIDELGGD
jgi:hypothetical protein